MTASIPTRRRNVSLQSGCIRVAVGLDISILALSIFVVCPPRQKECLGMVRDYQVSQAIVYSEEAFRSGSPSRSRLRTLTGPVTFVIPISLPSTSPRCKISTSPLSRISHTMRRLSSINSLHSDAPSSLSSAGVRLRGPSDGQIVFGGSRLDSNLRR